MLKMCVGEVLSVGDVSCWSNESWRCVLVECCMLEKCVDGVLSAGDCVSEALSAGDVYW
jgi:hypothetical protein